LPAKVSALRKSPARKTAVRPVPAPVARRLRADASRNREKLLAIAAAVFAEHGVDASLRLVEAAIADGSIRGDVDSADILQALSGIYSAPATPDWQERSRRLVSLLVDGLRWGAPKTSLPRRKR